MRVVHDKNVSQSSSIACTDEPKDSHQDSLVPSTIQGLNLAGSNSSLEIDYTSSLVSSSTSSETLPGNDNQTSKSETRTDDQEVGAFGDKKLENIQEKSNLKTYASCKFQTTEISLFTQDLRARHGKEISSKAETHTHTVKDDGYATGQSSTTMSVTHFSHDTASDYNTENHSSQVAENSTLYGKKEEIVQKQCCICKKKFTTIFNLSQHKQTVHGTKQYKCLHCSFTTARKFTLKRHQIKHQRHNKGKDDAPKSVTESVQTADNDIFTRQLRSSYGKKIDYRPQGHTSTDEADASCKFQTTAIDLFTQDLRARNGKEISSKAETHTHTVKDDGYTTGQSSTTMSIAHFSHDTASDYNTENHSSEVAENSTLCGKKEEIVQKQCCICKKKFTTIFNLSQHKQTVHGTKQYKCLHCSFTTARKFTLKRHQIKHQCHDKEKDDAPKSVTKSVQTADNDLFTRQLRSRYGKIVDYRPQGHTSTDEEDGNTTDQSDSTTSFQSFSYDSSTDSDKENHSSGDDNGNDKGSAVNEMKSDTGLQKEDPILSLRCNLCEVNFKKKSNLYRHNRTMHGPKTYKCSDCGYTARRKDTLRRHQKNHRQNNKEKRDATESATEHLRKYVNANNESVEMQRQFYLPRFYKCPFCPLITAREDYIVQHMNDLPVDTSMTEQLTQCQRRRLEQMKRTVTSLYRCSICSFQTIEKRTFNRHKRTAHVKKKTFPCKSCSMTFTKIHHLWYHCKVVHGPKIYKCHHCDYATDRKYNLDKHQKRFNCYVQPEPTDNLEESQGAPITTNPNKKVFDCNHCEYRTDRRELINLHQKRFHCHNVPNKTNNFDNPITDQNQSSVGQVNSMECLDQQRNLRGASHHVKAVEANCDSKNGVDSAIIAKHVNKNITNNRTKKRKINKGNWKISRAKKKGKTNLLQCNLCRITFKATNALKRHKISIHGPKLLNCDHCGYKTNRKDLFDRHGIRFNCSYNGDKQSSVKKSNRDVHAKEDSHEIMPHVETTNPIGYTKTRHSRSRTDTGADNRMKKDKSNVNSSPDKIKKKTHLLQCKSCNISFKKKISFIRHQKLIHEPKRFNCQHCGFKGNRKDTFDKHYNRFDCPKQSLELPHSDQLPGAVCSEEINSAEISHDLAVETTTIGTKANVNNSDDINTDSVNTCVYSDTSIHATGQEPTTAHKVAATNLFECKICKRTFKQRYRLKTHERKIHGPKEFNCCHCGFKSNDKVTFHKHYKRLSCLKESVKFDDLFQSERHTEGVNSSDALANVEKDVYTDAKISTAEDKVTRIINLLEVLKPLQCKICGYISKTKYKRERHEMMVHMLKPYNCSHCGFKAKDKLSLFKHYIHQNCANEKQKVIHSHHPQRDSNTIEENSEISSCAETDKLDTTDNSMFHSTQRAGSAEGDNPTDMHHTELPEARVDLDNGECVNSLDKNIMTTNLSNSIHMSCVDSAEMKKDGDSVFDSDICFHKDDENSIVYRSSENVHSKETACTDTHYVKRKPEKIVTDDADVLGLESVTVNIGIANNVMIPVADCINFNRSTDTTGRTATGVCFVNTAETDSNSQNEVSMGFITDTDKNTGTFDKKRNEADHKSVGDTIFESTGNTRTVQSPSASGSFHGTEMIDDFTDECSTDSPCHENVKTDANLDNETKLAKPEGIDNHNVSSDSKRKETDHMNEVVNLSLYQGDTKTLQSNSAYAPHNEAAETKIDSTDGYSIKNLCTELPEIKNESYNKSSQEITVDIAHEQNEHEGYHKSESCKSYSSQGKEQTVQTESADTRHFEMSDRVADISNRCSVKISFLETAEISGHSDSKSNVEMTVDTLNKCIGSDNQKRDETDNRNNNGHFLLQVNLQTLTDWAANAPEGGEMNLYKVDGCGKNVSSNESAEKIRNSHNKGTVDISSDIMNRNARIIGLKRHGIDYSNVGESPYSHAMPKNSSETSGPEGKEIKLDSVDGPRTDNPCSETTETNKHSHNKRGTIIIADVVNHYSNTIDEDRNESPKTLYATTQNSSGRFHVDKAKIDGDGASESFSYILNDQTSKTSGNLLFERSLNNALDIARSSVHTVIENSSIESNSSSSQETIKIHQVNRNDAPFQSLRNVDISSDIMNRNARINGLIRCGIDCGNVGESPCSHAVPKNSSETSGPEGAEMKLDSVHGSRNDIPCLETAETNEHSRNKHGMSIIADVVNLSSSIIDEDRNELPKKLHATPQNSSGGSHVNEAKMDADGASESFSYILLDKTSKTSRNLPFERNLDIALDIARNSVHTVNEISSIESKSSSSQGIIKIHQTSRNDAPFQSQRNVDIGSDIMNSNARINCIKRHGIDYSNVGESPYSHEMPKISSETFGPVGAEINLDSVDGPRTDILCLENAETNEHSHNKRDKIIIADVVNSYSNTIDEDRTDLPKILHATPQNSFGKSHVDKAKINADVTNESFSYIPHDKTSKTSRNLPFERSLDIALDIARNSVHTVTEISSIESKSSSSQGIIKIHQTNRNDALFQQQRDVYLTEKSSGDICSAEAIETNVMSDNGGIVNIANVSIVNDVNTCADIGNAEDITSRNVIIRKESHKYIVTSQAVENQFAGNVMDAKSVLYLKRFIKKKSTSRNREVETDLPRCRFCKIAFTRWALVRHHEKSVHKSQVSRKDPLSVSANKSSSHRIYSIPSRFVSPFSDTDQLIIGHSSHKKTEATEWKNLESVSESATKINSSSTYTNRTLPTHDAQKVLSSTQSVSIKNMSTVFLTDKKNIDHSLEKTSCNTDQTTEIGHSESLSKSATEYSSVYDADRGNVSLAIVDTDEHTTHLNVRNKLSIDKKKNVISMGHNTMPDSIHTTAQMGNHEFISKPAIKPRSVSNISTDSISSSFSIEKRNISEDTFGHHCNVRNSSKGCLKELDNYSSSHGSNTHPKNMRIGQRLTGPKIQGFLKRLDEAAAFIYCHDCDHVDKITYASNSVPDR